MSYKTLEINKVEHLAYEMEDKVESITLDRPSENMMLNFKIKGYKYGIQLPSGDYTLIGRVGEFDDDLWVEVMYKKGFIPDGFKPVHVIDNLLDDIEAFKKQHSLSDNDVLEDNDILLPIINESK